jgi:hypothetical protein
VDYSILEIDKKSFNASSSYLKKKFSVTAQTDINFIRNQVVNTLEKDAADNSSVTIP